MASIARAAFGPDRRLARVDRLRGGSKKGVYRLAFDDASSAVSYVWDESENYWPASPGEAPGDGADLLADASGSDLFEASQARLSALGVRTPRVYLLDRSRTAYPADIALVEDVRGGTLEKQLQRGRPAAGPILERLAAALQVMHQYQAVRPGRLAATAATTTTATAATAATAATTTTTGQHRSCEQIVLDRALADLADAAGRVGRVAAAHEQLEAATRKLAAAVRPRARCGLIHGELGPEHVLIDDQGHPVLIDIEGAMFFDIEWEHVFLELRFGHHYRQLRAEDLDEQRVRFYRLAMHLSLVAGPLRLLDGDFPDREPMMKIAELNTDRALAFLSPGGGSGPLGGPG